MNNAAATAYRRQLMSTVSVIGVEKSAPVFDPVCLQPKIGFNADACFHNHTGNYASFCRTTLANTIA